MIMEKRNIYARHIYAKCWIPGEPKEAGLFLIRIENCGNIWYSFNECRPSGLRPARMIYYDSIGGNYASNAFRGKLTHHCKATAENFDSILKTLKPHIFNMQTMSYELK